MDRTLNEEYFAWMYQLVCGAQTLKNLSYRMLLLHLNEREFIPVIDMDENRVADGIELRYRFGYEHRLPEPVIAVELDIRPCSILEMMLALSLRCEEHIMADSDIGDRTGQWVWNMIVNLGLASMNDARYDRKKVDEILDRFLNREYEFHGEGGLFTVRHGHRDMRKAEIWYQAMWYFNEYLNMY